MSVAICTLGMFNPATGSGGTTIIERDTGSSGYGYGDHKPKPVVLVQSVLSGNKEIEKRPSVIIREVIEI